MTTPQLADIDPFSSEVIENPWRFFAALREQAPLYRLPNGAYYLISRFEDVAAAAMNTEVFSSNLVAVLTADSDGTQGPQVLDVSGGSARATDVLAIADPPAHTRQRRISNSAFTVRRVATIEPRIRQLTESLIDAFIDSHEADWVQRLAVPLPMTIISELIGFPPDDIAQLKRWSDSSVALLSGVNTAEQLTEHAKQVGQMIDYLAQRFDQASSDPSDNVLGDLARAAENGDDVLTRDEAVSILVQLLTAGNETTTSLIGSALMLLLRDDGIQTQLRRHPDKIEPFIEEALRVEAPFHGHFRVVRKDTEIAGMPLPKGSRVMLLWSSANRDERQFSRADAVDLERAKPKSHLSFGHGIHHCIGASLARLEATVAIETILSKTRALRLADDNDYRHVPSLFVRSLKRLHIEFERA
jgi:cytochrome P450